MAVTDNWIHILANNVLHVYNASSVVFTSTISATSLGSRSIKSDSLDGWWIEGPVNESILLIGSSGATFHD